MLVIDQQTFWILQEDEELIVTSVYISSISYDPVNYYFGQEFSQSQYRRYKTYRFSMFWGEWIQLRIGIFFWLYARGITSSLCLVPILSLWRELTFVTGRLKEKVCII